MSPDDDWALGQNEVDVRNEARNPLNAMPLRPVSPTRLSWLERYARGAEDRAATWHIAMVERGDRLHDDGDWADCQHVSCVTNREYVRVFACRNPEQAWIDESRAEAEREAESHNKE